MNSINEVKDAYRHLAEETTAELKKVKQQSYHVGTWRLLFFVAGVAGLIYYRTESWDVLTGVALVTFLPFMLLIKYHNLLFHRKDYLEKKVEINKQELAALDYDTSAFDGGQEFADPTHLYTFDLDVFGQRSLFQCVNRTCTELGKKRLAAWMNLHLEDKREIDRRQEAIKELAPELKFRQRFRILGLLHSGKSADEAELKTWAKEPAAFRARRLTRALPVLVTGTNMLCIGLVIAGVLPAMVYGAIWTGFVAAGFVFTGRITRAQAIYGKKLQILSTYAELLRLIEQQSARSTLLKEIKEEIGGEVQQAASQSIGQLNKLMNELDQRNNIFMYILLNGTFFWELRQIMRIEAWKERHAAHLPCWLNAIGQIDALNSLGTFAYNHPDYSYPDILDKTEVPAGSFRLRATDMGHPLMNRERCVHNDIDMKKRPFFIIITGANMAGKSTYLRTVGVNYLLACIGAPVCARRMEVTPARLITSLRTSDSLNGNESYFFAELKRLKLIIDKLHAGEELFIILDEILKGTNSTDKQKGSLALIKQFMNLQANGIIATHDLLLGTLVDSFPDNIRNNCFEADIVDNRLSFSYRLRPGIARNMNACFLMQKMGIAVTDLPHNGLTGSQEQ